jgi:hypothetical protein
MKNYSLKKTQNQPVMKTDQGMFVFKLATATEITGR